MGGSWHNWEDLGRPVPNQGSGSNPSCVAWGPVKPDQIHCFVRGPQGKMWHKGWWNGAWQSWEDMGRPPGKNVDSRGPRCLAWGLETPNQLHCFTMASDENDPYQANLTLWHRGWWDGAWHDWEQLGKPANTTFEAQPECMAWGLSKPNQLHCFAYSQTSTEHHFWHRWWADGSWSGWQDLGGPPKQTVFTTLGLPSCIAWGLNKPDQLHCFVNFEGALWHKGWWEGNWHAWQNLGPQGNAAAHCLGWGLSKPDQLHCFALGGKAETTLRHIGWWSGMWQPWQDLGHP